VPPLTRWFIKFGLIYLVAALLTGAILATRPLWNLPPVLATLSPVYFHLLMVGWVTQIIFGVVYWMFPKYSKEKPHGSENLWRATFWLLNVGLALRVFSEPTQGLRAEAGWLLALSAVLQWLAGLAFVVNTWGRVKER
jgi:cbb3-type cytochrome oxidase subunit 1